MSRQYTLLLAFPLILSLLALYLMSEEIEPDSDTINAVIGDESYIRIYGTEPGKNIPDHVRIRIHLDYVEGILRNRPMNHLTAEQAINRIAALDMLRDYILAEEFPHNDGHPDQRRPTFISDNGRICAVGWLIEQTEGRSIAEKVNEIFKYAFIQEIDHPVFLKWAEQSGFTIEELAMIQPQYGPIITEEAKENRNQIGISYGVGSALSMGANALYLSSSSNDPRMFSNPGKNHWFGLAAGSASVLFGVLNIRNERVYLEPNGDFKCMMGCVMTEITETNHLRSGVAAANIGVGLVNMARAGYHLLRGTETEQDPSGLGVSHLNTDPLKPGSVVPALSYTVRF